ncbi:hypothetical protein [Ramlibacter sp.]|uniref:hypothetical protein n=1 Tax=Ramlibacter sp. TaxID=1917967 RepID=UPI003D09C716
MPLVATPHRRRLVVIVLMVLATLGGVIRYYAPNPSTARDLGTLMLVLWLPTLGMIVGHLLGKIRRRPSTSPGFPRNSEFVPQLRVSFEALPVSGNPPALDPQLRGCIALVGGEGFTCRISQPLAHSIGQSIAQAAPGVVELELLRPAVALPKLPPGTEFYFVVGTLAVARGRVEGRIES